MSHIPPYPRRAHRALPHWPPLQDSRGRTLAAPHLPASERITAAEVVVGSFAVAAGTLVLVWIFAVLEALAQ